MKLVMVSTSQGYWDGIAGNIAMFSEAVVQAALLHELPGEPVDTVFVKKNPFSRKFERAWKGKSSDFKKISKQEKDYLSFKISGLKEINCPEVLRNKPVGCHILTESLDNPHVAPRRPMKVAPRLAEDEQKEKIVLESGKQDLIEDALEAGVLRFRNGQHKEMIAEAPEIAQHEEAEQPVRIEQAGPAVSINGSYAKQMQDLPEDETMPAFTELLKKTNDPALFEKYCFQLLRLLGIHDLHRPEKHAGADSYGFFKFNTLGVVYSCTLVPAVVRDNRMITEHYLNLLKKEKIQFANTSYTLKDSQKQVWIISREGTEQVIRTEDGIKLKLVSADQLLALYSRRMAEEGMNSDNMWEALKNI